MNFPALDQRLPIETRQDLFDFFDAALEYRGQHRKYERALALYVFNVTRSVESMEWYVKQLDDIRHEFAALEAPGLSDDPTHDAETYANSLWERLEYIVDKAK